MQLNAQSNIKISMNFQKDLTNLYYSMISKASKTSQSSSHTKTKSVR